MSARAVRRRTVASRLALTRRPPRASLLASRPPPRARAPPRSVSRAPLPAAAFARAAGDDDAESGASATTESGDAIDDDDATVAGTVRRKRAEAAAKAAKRDPSLADINPLDLGRKSRKFVDGIFKSITGSPRSPARPASTPPDPG